MSGHILDASPEVLIVRLRIRVSHLRRWRWMVSPAQVREWEQEIAAILWTTGNWL